MLHKQQLVFDSLRRVQASLDTHVKVVGPLKDTEARKQLDAAVAAADAQGVAQGAATRAFGGSGNEVKQFVDDLKLNHMTPVAKFARANLRGVPTFKALTTVPHNLRGASLVLAARAMATAAAPYADRLAKAQFPADSIQQLANAADALKAALDARVAARAARVVATAGIKQQLALGREAVAMLDPIVTKMFAGQKDLLAGWRSAKRVTLTPGSAVVAVAVPVATPVVTPQAPAQEVKAA
jgi:hypothetical protein